MVMGLGLLVLIAVGFEFEIAWLFVGALVLLLLFVGYLLFTPPSEA
jgi:hypothetical protein